MEPVIYWQLLVALVHQVIKELTAHNWTRLTLAGQLVTLQLILALDKALVIKLLDAPVMQVIKGLIVHNWTPLILAGRPVTS